MEFFVAIPHTKGGEIICSCVKDNVIWVKLGVQRNWTTWL